MKAAYLILMAVSLQAQQNVIRLWPGVAPGSETWTQKEAHVPMQMLGGDIVRNVVEPTLTVYAPEKGTANGTAIIVCPGGGFQFLSWTNEGTAMADWLNKLGVTVFLLKYRVMDTGATNAEFEQAIRAEFQNLMTDFASVARKLAPSAAIAEQDGRKAVELVRQDAAKWGVNPNRIGIIGFSAGATVSLNASSHYTAAGRPDFAAFIYGSAIQPENVPKDAPPVFVLCAADDPIVPPVSSLTTYSSWKSTGHSAELHIYDKGGHGFGMSKRGMPVDHWTEPLQEWLNGQGMLKRP